MSLILIVVVYVLHIHIIAGRLWQVNLLYAMGWIGKMTKDVQKDKSHPNLSSIIILVMSNRNKKLLHLDKKKPNYEYKGYNYDCRLTNSYVKNDVAMLGATLTVDYQQVNKKQGPRHT